MDRQIVYIGAIPQDTDQLQQNKNAMIGLGYALQALLGSSTVVDGLACTPNSPAALNVLVGPGSIYSLQEVDATAYGSLAADTTDQIVKQGIITNTQTFSTPAPTTSGQSVVYLIEAAYQDVDGGSTVLPYYNAANSSVAWSGPNNTGTSQNTVRKGVCTVQIKTGTAATTGTQTTPAPDAGFTGLYAITVANGQSTVTSGNIQQLSTAPFIATKIPAIQTAIQSQAPNYAQDSSGSANTITVTLSPAPAALTNGQPIRVKVANTNTSATVMNVNGLGNVSVVTTTGSALASGSLVANGIYEFVYDGNGTRWQVQAPTPASTNTYNFFTGGTSTGSANAQVLSTASPSGFSLSINGATVALTAGYSNTGATTFNVNSTGATAVQKNSGSGLTPLTGGEINAGDLIFLTVNTSASCLVLTDGPALGTAAGKAASNASDSTVASVTGSITAGHVAVFADTVGSVEDGGAPSALQLMTPLGVGSIIFASCTITVSAGTTVSASHLTVALPDLGGADAGVVPTGDSITGYWIALISYTVVASQNIGLWQKVS